MKKKFDKFFDFYNAYTFIEKYFWKNIEFNK